MRAAPLAPGYSETPLWHEATAAGRAARPIASDPLPAEVDVVVVGAGYCGVAAAADLAARGRSVLVVEADEVGTGASTRNGGMVIPELKLGPAALVRRYGAPGDALARTVLDAYDHLEHRVRDLAIDCDYSRTGGLLLAHHPAVLPGLRTLAREWTEFGEDVRFLDGNELSGEIGSHEFHGAVRFAKTGAVHPARLHEGLLAHAEAQGARIHGCTRVLGIETATSPAGTSGGRIVRTARGDVRAGDVLAAVNAYADGALPPLRDRVLPVGSFVLATEVLDPDLAAAVLPTGRMCFDTRHLLSYWRLSPDGRLVFGGRASLSHTTVAEARDVLYEAMLRVHPQLAGVRVTHAWTGNVAVTVDRMPHVGRFDGVAYATGCNGTGVALATWLGARVAAWMSGDEPPPPFAQLQFRRVPFRSARALWMPPGGAVLRVADRYGR